MEVKNRLKRYRACNQCGVPMRRAGKLCLVCGHLETIKLVGPMVNLELEFVHGDKFMVLKPEDRFMSCKECAFTTPCQGELSEQSITKALPSEISGGCPDCGYDLERIDAFAYKET